MANKSGWLKAEDEILEAAVEDSADSSVRISQIAHHLAANSCFRVFSPIIYSPCARLCKISNSDIGSFPLFNHREGKQHEDIFQPAPGNSCFPGFLLLDHVCYECHGHTRLGLAWLLSRAIDSVGFSS